jgi:hypothetical protein
LEQLHPDQFSVVFIITIAESSFWHTDLPHRVENCYQFSVHPENRRFMASIDKIVSAMGAFVFLFRFRCRAVF